MFYNALTGHVYSAKNQDALALSFGEDPEAPVAVAGFQQWRKLGRTVTKGQKASRVMMVCDKKFEDDDGEIDKRKVCKTLAVFFESQTDEYGEAKAERAVPEFNETDLADDEGLAEIEEV